MRTTQSGSTVLGVSDASVFPVVAVRNVAFDTSFFEPVTYLCIKWKVLTQRVDLQLFFKELQEQ